ncbi:MAG: hypothetical protein HND39_06195 [Ignavibacteriota bacterium]|jgi:hypothetical protein|nr:MAG: hypothetical protein EDM72_01825 [Chlorobiota bacterium]MBE7475862.1 hypothetical protein [Ignavibacteriales bacterium]MBL1123330.1 hypothetical protein [Ignavibacteriota bacterium]MBV6420333.1 hypothetical protein [Ignavibacteriaceae bacterium]MCE7856531.1 hypothetical protein [Ignavibacteria bacterium CHB3]MEB2295460.1 hypothetical protein [Ignavibacteria bacterium]
MPTFNDFISTVKNDLLDFAKENFEEYKDELLKDGSTFLEKTRSDIERWTEGLASGALSPADFEFLLKGKKDIAQMEALKQIGLSKIRISKITNGIIDVMVGSAVKTFL